MVSPKQLPVQICNHVEAYHHQKNTSARERERERESYHTQELLAQPLRARVKETNTELSDHTWQVYIFEYQHTIGILLDNICLDIGRGHLMLYVLGQIRVALCPTMLRAGP